MNKSSTRTSYSAAKAAGMSRREKRLLLRLLVSSAVLLLTMLGRVLMPEVLDAWEDRISDVMRAEMDVQEVFSAVGRAVSGTEEAGGWDEVYRAVFAPEEDGAAPIANVISGQTQSPPCYGEENVPERVAMTQQVLGFAYASPLAAEESSAFGIREDPFSGEEDFHYGIDLAAEEGREITAFADGTVRTAGKSTILGNYLILDHADGFSTLYAHCSRLLVTAGEAVSLGDSIAEVGQSGSATGSHLHFELQRGSTYLNPVYYLV